MDLPPISHFTTFAARKNSQDLVEIAGLELHLLRLINASSELTLLGFRPLELDDLKALLDKELESAFYKYKCKNLRVKIAIVPNDSTNPDIIFHTQILSEFKERDSPLLLMPYNGVRPLPHIKSSSTLLSSYAHAKAVSLGFDTALLIESDLVRETAWGNLVWFDKSGQLYYNKTRCLDGVTQRLFIQKYNEEQSNSGCSKVAEPKEFSLDELVNESESIYVCSSIIGAVKAMVKTL